MSGFDGYRGYTHPIPMFLLPLWKRWMCKRNMHAFDEVASIDENYFSCDACGISVDIYHYVWGVGHE